MWVENLAEIASNLWFLNDDMILIAHAGRELGKKVDYVRVSSQGLQDMIHAKILLTIVFAMGCANVPGFFQNSDTSSFTFQSNFVSIWQKLEVS